MKCLTSAPVSLLTLVLLVSSYGPNHPLAARVLHKDGVADRGESEQVAREESPVRRCTR